MRYFPNHALDLVLSLIVEKKETNHFQAIPLMTEHRDVLASAPTGMNIVSFLSSFFSIENLQFILRCLLRHNRSLFAILIVSFRLGFISMLLESLQDLERP